jgi:hypothetical protein
MCFPALESEGGAPGTDAPYLPPLEILPLFAVRAELPPISNGLPSMVGRMAWGALCNRASRKSHFSMKSSWNREIRQIRERRGFSNLGLRVFRVEVPVQGQRSTRHLFSRGLRISRFNLISSRQSVLKTLCGLCVPLRQNSPASPPGQVQDEFVNGLGVLDTFGRNASKWDALFEVRRSGFRSVREWRFA